MYAVSADVLIKSRINAMYDTEVMCSLKSFIIYTRNYNKQIIECQLNTLELQIGKNAKENLTCKSFLQAVNKTIPKKKSYLVQLTLGIS